MMHSGDPFWTKRIPAMAWLLEPARDSAENYRTVCLGCSGKLHDLGMLAVIKEMPFNESQPEFSTVVYVIAPGYTLAECQAAVPEHVGPPAWGERL